MIGTKKLEPGRFYRYKTYKIIKSSLLLYLQFDAKEFKHVFLKHDDQTYVKLGMNQWEEILEKVELENETTL